MSAREFIIGGGHSIKEYQDQGFDFFLLNDEYIVGANGAYLVCKLNS